MRKRRLMGQIEHATRTFGTGHVGSLDTRHKRRGKKQPLGFAPPKSKRRARGREV